MKRIELSEENIVNNINQITNMQPNKTYMQVIKGNAYGHGAVELAKVLYDNGCKYWCVAEVHEAIELRQKFKDFDDIEILVLYGIFDNELEMYKKYNLTATISSFNDFLKHKDYLLENNIKFHVVFDSGMNREGIKEDKILDIKNELLKQNYAFEGIYTHIAQYEVSYEETLKEVNYFKEIVSMFSDFDLKYIHYMNSASLQMFKTTFDNAIRCGNILYGYYDFDKDYAKQHLAKYNIYENTNVKPILQLVATVKDIKHVKKGEFIGYGSFQAPKDMKICYIDYGKLDGVIKVVDHDIWLNNTRRKQITPPAMNHIFIELNDDDKVGDKITLYKDLNYQAKQLNCRPIDFIAYLKKEIPRKIVKKF